MSNKVKRETAKERRRRQLVAFAGHMMSYATVPEAARAAGISARTASRWLRTQEFAEVYTASREATLRNLSGLLRQSAIGAVECLAAVVRNSDAAPTARTNAARSILDSLLKIAELQELDERLSKLEQTAGDMERQ